MAPCYKSNSHKLTCGHEIRASTTACGRNCLRNCTAQPASTRHAGFSCPVCLLLKLREFVGYDVRIVYEAGLQGRTFKGWLPNIYAQPGSYRRYANSLLRLLVPLEDGELLECEAENLKMPETTTKTYITTLGKATLTRVKICAIESELEGQLELLGMESDSRISDKERSIAALAAALRKDEKEVRKFWEEGIEAERGAMMETLNGLEEIESLEPMGNKKRKRNQDTATGSKKHRTTPAVANSTAPNMAASAICAAWEKA